MQKLINNYLSDIRCFNLETGDFPGPVVTISRQAGCSAKRIAIKLSKILTGYCYMSETKTEAEWRWVDKDIFTQVVEDMIAEIDEGRFDDQSEAVDLLNKVAMAFTDETIYDISDEKLIKTLKAVICRLANKGRHIIVGRSAGVILKNVPNKLNIRLEAPTSWRINRIMQLKDYSQAEAADFILEMDSKRDSFIEKVIGRKAQNNDFDIIFNYASLEDDQIVDVVINILRSKKIIQQHGSY